MRGGWSEGEAVEFLKRVFATHARSIVLGIGDDAALVKSPRAPLVLTIDTCVEHVHFEQGWLRLEDVGFRATQAAVSDLAAMGARPLAALSNLTLPPSAGRRVLAAIARGQAAAAKALGCPIAGGNLSRGTEISVTTAVVGSAAKPLRRAGARAGDELWLTGQVGVAAAGLSLLRARLRGRTAAERACIAAWRRPSALLEQGRKLVGRASACCDVSDGLARDAAHLGEASRVRIVIEAQALRAALAPALVEVAAGLETDALALALEGGEDYALLATGDAARRPRFARRIGRVEQGRGRAELETISGKRRPLTGGFDHLTAR